MKKRLTIERLTCVRNVHVHFNMFLVFTAMRSMHGMEIENINKVELLPVIPLPKHSNIFGVRIVLNQYTSLSVPIGKVLEFNVVHVKVFFNIDNVISVILRIFGQTTIHHYLLHAASVKERFYISTLHRQ